MIVKNLALLNLGMIRQIHPHPSPLPKGEGTRLLAPFSPGRRVGEALAPLREEGNSYPYSATPATLLERPFVLSFVFSVCVAIGRFASELHVNGAHLFTVGSNGNDRIPDDSILER